MGTWSTERNTSRSDSADLRHLSQTKLNNSLEVSTVTSLDI